MVRSSIEACKNSSELITVGKRITTFSDLLFFLEADRLAAGSSQSGRLRVIINPVCRFQIVLRLAEYLGNDEANPFKRALYVPVWFWLNSLRIRLGFTIPRNVFGPGLSIAHYGSIVVNERASVGSNCRIHPGVCIGGLRGNAPTIGDNVYLAPGCKIFGGVKVGDGCAVGANAVVTRDVEAGLTVAGIPARVISEKGSTGLLVRATEVLRTNQLQDESLSESAGDPS